MIIAYSVIVTIALVILLVAFLRLMSIKNEQDEKIEELITSLEADYLVPIRIYYGSMNEFSKLQIFSDDSHVKEFVSLAESVKNYTISLIKEIENLRDDDQQEEDE